MTIFLHDGSLDGLLCAIDLFLAQPGTDCAIERRNQWQPALFDDPCDVAAHPDVADRLLQRIAEYISRETRRLVLSVYMAERVDLDTPLGRFLREGFRLGAAVEQYHAHPDVRAVMIIARKVSTEIHRFKGLTRFRELADGTLWAPIEPNYDILQPLAQHFRHRLGAERWVLHDVGRGKALGWDGQALVVLDDLKPGRLAEHENRVAHLWRTFYETVNIQARLNPALRRQHMPVRYWTYLTELAT